MSDINANVLTLAEKTLRARLTTVHLCSILVSTA
jgi:hypothetical protein